MFPMKNGLNSINILYTGSHKRFPINYGPRGREFLKLIVAYLYCTKYNEINIFHLDVKSMFHIQDKTKYS